MHVWVVLGSELLILFLECQCDASERDPKPASDWFFTDDPCPTENCSQSDRNGRKPGTIAQKIARKRCKNRISRPPPSFNPKFYK